MVARVPWAMVGPSQTVIDWGGRRRRREAGTNNGGVSLMRRTGAGIAGRHNLEFCATLPGGRVRLLSRDLLALRHQVRNQAPREFSNRNEPTFALPLLVTALHAPEIAWSSYACLRRGHAKVAEFRT